MQKYNFFLIYAREREIFMEISEFLPEISERGSATKSGNRFIGLPLFVRSKSKLFYLWL